jgi:hypothetical protein
VSVRRALAIGVLVLLAPRPEVQAKTIGVTTEVRVTAEPGALAVVVKLTNSGDEAAKTVVPIVRVADHEARGEGRSTLAPGESIESTVRVPFDRPAGQWPLVTRVDYADANGYPFQALQVALVSSPPATPALVAVVDVAAEPVVDSGRIRARLKSLSDAPRRAQVRFVTPRGLEMNPALLPLDMEPWADATVEAEVVNRAALAGSRYPVFVTVEYDDRGEHHASVAHAMVEIHAPVPRRVWTLLGVAAALLLAWVALLVWRRMSRPPA